MKKEYTKPNMEVVSLKSENIATDARSLTVNPVQTTFTTIDY